MAKKRNTGYFMSPNSENEVRLDKWLWAARFYKTRSIARSMIEGGKVHYNGTRSKPSRIVEINARIQLWQGYNQIEVVVCGISDTRRSAEEARKLYTETDASREHREKLALASKMQLLYAPHPKDKPDKKQRRELLSLKHGLKENNHEM